MSVSRRDMVSCPSCGHEQEMEIFTGVDASDAAAKAALLDGRLFRFVCDGCGEGAMIKYPCLYHDPDRALTLYLLPDFTQEDLGRLRATAPASPEEGVLRVTGTCNGLIEKVKIADAGRDDRVTELCKLVVAAGVAAEWPDFKPDNIYFDASPAEKFVILSPDGRCMSAPLPDELYDELSERLAALPVQAAAAPLVVDRAWASRILELIAAED